MSTFVAPKNGYRAFACHWVSAMASNSYRQYIPHLGLSIELLTEAVPSDGKYHVVRNGEIVGSFRSLKQAQAIFRQLVQDSGYKPSPPQSSKTVSEIMTEQYMEAKELYWVDSHKYRGGGGRGGRGGV